MQARKLISDECRDPEMLKQCTLAFDEAWAVIGDGFAHDPTLAAAMRLGLARIILNLQADELADTALVRTNSLRTLAASCPSHADTIHRLLAAKSDTPPTTE